MRVSPFSRRFEQSAALSIFSAWAMHESELSVSTHDDETGPGSLGNALLLAHATGRMLQGSRLPVFPLDAASRKESGDRVKRSDERKRECNGIEWKCKSANWRRRRCSRRSGRSETRSGEIATCATQSDGGGGSRRETDRNARERNAFCDANARVVHAVHGRAGKSDGKRKRASHGSDVPSGRRDGSEHESGSRARESARIDDGGRKKTFERGYEQSFVRNPTTSFHADSSNARIRAGSRVGFSKRARSDWKARRFFGRWSCE